LKDQSDVTSDAGTTAELITTDVSPKGNYKVLFYNLFTLHDLVVYVESY